MASIYKRNKRKNEPYTIQYLDHLGKRRTKKGFTDKGLSEELAAKLESEARLRTAGLIDPLQDKIAGHKQTAIAAHLDAFEESLADNSPKYVLRSTPRRCRPICESSAKRRTSATALTTTTCKPWTASATGAWPPID